MSKQEIWSAEQFQKHYQKTEAAKMKSRRNKFGNIPVEIDGIKFQSTKEAKYYGYLKIQRRAGIVSQFQMQKIFSIIVNEQLICHYIADFVVWMPDGTCRVIDVKGEATRKHPLFRIKEKLMLAVLGIKIEIA